MLPWMPESIRRRFSSGSVSWPSGCAPAFGPNRASERPSNCAPQPGVLIRKAKDAAHGTGISRQLWKIWEGMSRESVRTHSGPSASRTVPHEKSASGSYGSDRDGAKTDALPSPREYSVGTCERLWIGIAGRPIPYCLRQFSICVIPQLGTEELDGTNRKTSFCMVRR